MDDGDEYGSDIAEEDFLEALTQLEAPHPPPQLTLTKDTHKRNPPAVGSGPSGGVGGGNMALALALAPASTSTSTSTSFRQTTLFGNALEAEDSTCQASSRPNYRGHQAAQEPPTHHSLDQASLKTWVYPTNLGPIRDYQYSIVNSSLFSNTLVALPTGLGKTFIAATVMLNFYRWTNNAKIIFVAPTKPLVSQQIDACFNIAGIPRSETTLLTGSVSPALRAQEWTDKRVFFMTPQTLYNDLSRGIADPKSIVLLVVDEAHRSTGEYAYAKVVKFMRRFNNSFRILALTATPGSTVEVVQEIIDNLGISNMEIRTEESIDIRQYVHQRNIDQVLVDPSDEMNEIKDLFARALKPLTDKLSQKNVFWGRDPMSITSFGLMKLSQEWMNGPGKHANQGLKNMIRAVFGVLQGMAHSIKLLNFHGITPFYANMKEFREEVENAGSKGSKNKQQLAIKPEFQEMMKKVESWVKMDSFISHPKISHLCDTVLNHFMDHGETKDSIPTSGSGTRIIIFSEYRDSAEDIVRVLAQHKPLVRASVFVGQADSKRSEGMKQKTQIETIQQFKTGGLNVLVATSIGEEGLDIGQVDLIICYDASASPIRMLQRMGRTGRKRTGNIVLLLMRGKEQESYEKAKDNYSRMQSLICEGSRFHFRYDLSTRIVPLDAYKNMEVDKRAVNIPIENTQNPALPEPTKRGKKPKMPPKKFHMPDNVETGFQRASDLGQASIKSSFAKTRPKSKPKPKPKEPSEMDFVVEVPLLQTVLLSEADMLRFKRAYKNLPFNATTPEDIDALDMSAYPELQRQLQKSCIIGHGSYTKRCVKMFKTLGGMGDVENKFDMPYGGQDRSIKWKYIRVPPFSDEGGTAIEDGMDHPGSVVLLDDGDDDDIEVYDISYKSTKKQRRPAKKRTFAASFEESDVNNGGYKLSSPPPPKKRELSGKDISTYSKPGPGAEPKPRVQSTKQIKAAVKRADAMKMKADALRRKSTSQIKARAKTKTKTKTKRGTPAQKRGHVNDAGEDYGDSCMRSEDLVPSSDGSDAGSDLDDFLVGDEVPSSQLRDKDMETCALSHLPTPFMLAINSDDRGTKQSNMVSGYMATEPLEDDDDDDDDDDEQNEYGGGDYELPSLSQMATSSKKMAGRSSGNIAESGTGRKRIEDIDDSSESELIVRKRRFMVWGSDDDYDEY